MLSDGTEPKKQSHFMVLKDVMRADGMHYITVGDVFLKKKREKPTNRTAGK